MAIKKSALYSKLWQSCDELRGSMDPSQYKDYILTLLFLKYISDKKDDPNLLLEVPEECTFADLLKHCNKTGIGEKINIAIRRIAEENDLESVIDFADFNNHIKLGKDKDMTVTLTKLLKLFDDLDLSKQKAGDDDLLGDAYEYLMRHFAKQSGKSSGQFYTPAEVSRILAEVVGINEHTKPDQTVYDPTCGSGSLLLKAVDKAPNGLTIYGQEKDNSTFALARMNMVLHKQADAELKQGNTLADPAFKEAHDENCLKKFDFLVANPPFSLKSWTNGLHHTEDDILEDIYHRFGYGVPPEKNGDFAFLLHMLKSMKSTGSGAVILPHGVLFRGNAEADIRQKLIQQGHIKAVIGLPANLFYGTGIPACIIVLDKSHATERTGIFMIDASSGFIKDGNKNRLQEADIHKIVDVYQQQLELKHFSRFVPMSEIQANDYNLNLPRYIESQDTEVQQDIAAHLQGGLPQADIDGLEEYWQVFPELKQKLFSSLRSGYMQLNMPVAEIHDALLQHPEVQQHSKKLQDIFNAWCAEVTPKLRQINEQTSIKNLIHTISESLLQAFKAPPLIDGYKMYQHLMSYWFDMMQDDVYLVKADGYQAKPELIIDKDKKGKEVEKGWYCELFSKELIIAHYFKAEQQEIDALQAEQDSLQQQREELIEEHSTDEGCLADLEKINKAEVTKLLKELKKQPNSQTEQQILTKLIHLYETEAKLKKQAKNQTENLDQALLNKLGELTPNQVQDLLVENKWLAYLQSTLSQELSSSLQHLEQQILDVHERYQHALPELENQIQSQEQKVQQHLEAMGFSW